MASAVIPGTSKNVDTKPYQSDPGQCCAAISTEMIWLNH